MYKKKKSPFRSICINTDTSFLTAWSNDDSYENIFTRQLEALGDPGDVLIVLSTSGNSKNVVNATNLAKKDNIEVISLTGNDGGKLKIFQMLILIYHQEIPRDTRSTYFSWTYSMRYC